MSSFPLTSTLVVWAIFFIVYGRKLLHSPVTLVGSLAALAVVVKILDPYILNTHSHDKFNRLVRPAGIWNHFYTLLHLVGANNHLRLMNWGFAEQTDDVKVEDPEVYRKRLYLETLSGVKPYARLLEVGCGNGGGLKYLSHTYREMDCHGIDRCASNVKQCVTKEGLQAKVDDAQTLATCADASFDAVLNVESSHCYPEVNKFYASVARVLKPGGTFHYTDFAPADSWSVMEGELAKCGLEVKSKRDITGNVLRSSRNISKHYRNCFPVASRIPVVKTLFERFANAPESPDYKEMAAGKVKYMLYRFQRT